ncbi:MAG: 1,4-dihydroxy-2-naphthoate polyprenyltransferase, partial [Actinobacteria bacterium]|nr:1,4-dihydroxy-2-naphthoate polyprenyltransferase [Actinomycetota bacterium]
DSLSREVFLASIAMGCLACAILILNNLRDLEKDKKSGKQTLAVKIGESATRNLFRWSLFVPLALSVALSFFSFYYLIALVTLPLAGRLVRSVRSGADGESLIPLLALSGRLQILYALALSLAALLVAR